MKTIRLAITLAVGLFTTAAGLTQNVPNEDPPPPPVDVTNAPDPVPPPDDTPQPPAPADDTAPPAVTPDATTNSAATPPSAPAIAPAPMRPQRAPASAFVVTNMPGGEKGLRFNFRGVPLEQVLNYMSDAAGFIIHPKNGVDVRGKVDAWSAQPLSKEEAVKLLQQILSENGYTAIQDGRTLTILRSQDAKYVDNVNTVLEADKVPNNQEVVTDIIPIRSLNAVQLVKDLEAVRPTGATLSANDSANSLVMTGTQADIRHFTEIVRALDGINSSSATIRVYPLKYADSKSLASLFKDLFPSADTSRTGNGGGGNNPFGRFRGFGGGGGGGGFNPFGGGGGGGDTSTESNGHTPTAKVTAVSDDHSNSLIVSAPDSLINDIDALVKSVDTAVDETTTIQVFHLKNADATETASLLTALFPADTSTSDATRQNPFRFGPFGGGQQTSTSAAQSDRMKKMAQVVAVADQRTQSLVVTAGKDLMPQIEAMVKELDERTDRKMTAYVMPLQYAEPIDVVPILQAMFPSSTTTSSSLNSASLTQNNWLLTRAQTQLQQQNSQTTSSFGTGSTGSRTGN